MMLVSMFCKRASTAVVVAATALVASLTRKTTDTHMQATLKQARSYYRPWTYVTPSETYDIERFDVLTRKICKASDDSQPWSIAVSNGEARLRSQKEVRSEVRRSLKAPLGSEGLRPEP